MVKKTDDVKFDDVDLDEMDFGNIDGDMSDDMSFDMKDDRDPITIAKESAKNTLNKQMFDTSWLRHLMGMALPKGYSLALNAYDDASNVVKDVYKENRSELTPYLQTLNRKISSANPTLKRFIPKFVLEALEEVDEESSSQSAGSSDDPLSTNLKSMDELFKLQVMQNAEGRMKEAQNEIVEKRRFATEFEVLQEMSRGIQRLVAYQDSILINYQRKHLEINYRQFDVSSKLLASTVKYHDESSSLLKQILKNSGLPDWVKMQSTEVLQQRVHQRMADMAANSVGGWVGKYFSKVSENLKTYASGAFQALGMLEQAEDSGMSKAGLAGDITGSFAGEYAASKIRSMIESVVAELSPMLKEIPGLESTGRSLRDLFTDIPLKLNRWAQESEDTSTPRGMAMQSIKSIIPQYTPPTIIKGLGYENIDRPAMFDELFHKSVVEIIPGYLASIDKWIRTLATGEEQEEVAYSLYAGGFVTRSELNKQHIRLGLKAGHGDVIKTDVERIMRSIDADEKDEEGNPYLSEEAKRAIRKKLLTSMSNGLDFKPADYIDPTVWTDISESAAEEIVEHFAEKFGLGLMGNQYQFTDEIDKRLSDVSEIYSDTVKRIPNFAGRMDVLSNTIGRRSFRELGLSKYDNRMDDVVQLDKLYDMLVNDGTEVDDSAIEARDLERRRPSEEKFPTNLNELVANVDSKRRKIIEERERKRQLDMAGVDIENIDVLGKAKGQLALERMAAGGPTAPVTGIPSSAEAAALQRIEQVISASLTIPDNMTVKDLETHLRLDSLIQMVGSQTEVLGHILAAIPYAGSAGGGGGDGDGSIEPPKPNLGSAEWFKSLPGRMAGGIAKGVGKALGWAWEGTKGYGRFAGKVYGGIAGGIGLAAKGLWWTAKSPFTTRLKMGAMDIYVAGEETPAITAKGIRRGEYVDVNTRKVISGISDITGPVLRYGDSVEQVLSQEEFDKGLVNGEGNSLASLVGRAGASIGAGAASLLYGYTRGSYGIMGWGIKKAVGLVTNQFRQFDAYFPGDKEPRIRSKLLRKNFYRKADGSPLTSLDEIDGPVYDIDDNEVISQDDIDRYKSLYTRNGSLLYTIGRGFGSAAGWIADKAWTGVKAYGRLVGKVYKGMWKVGKGALGLAVKPFSKLAGKLHTGWKNDTSEIGGMDDFQRLSISICGEQLKVQKDILHAIREQFAEDDPDKWDLDGDGVRDNSWADKLRKRATGKESTGESKGPSGLDDLVGAISSLGDRLAAEFSDLRGTVEDAGEDSWVDQAADLKTIFGDGPDIGSDRERGRGRGGRRRRGGGSSPTPNRKKGWFAKTVDIVRPVGEVAAGYLAARGITGASIGSALKNPKLQLAVGAVVGAYGIYRWSKDYQARKYPLLNLRLVQYGIDPSDEEQATKIMALEELVKPGVKISGERASIDPKSFSPSEVFSIFDVEEGSERGELLLQWLASRFRPVFLAHCQASKQVTGKLDFTQLDSTLSNDDRAFYVSMVDLRGMGMTYDNTEVSPFDSDLDSDAGDVADAVKLAKDVVENEKEKLSESKPTIPLRASAKLALDRYKSETKLKVSVDGKSGKEAAVVDELDITNRATVDGRISQHLSKSIKLNSLDIPTAVRYKVYGLKSFTIAKVEALAKIEELFWGILKYNGTANAYIETDYKRLEFQVVSILKPANFQKEQDVKYWLRHRFLPAFLQYAISGRRRFNGDARNIHRSLTPVLLRAVLEEMVEAKADVEYSKMSVWIVTRSPWSDEGLEVSPGSVAIYLDSLPVPKKGPLSVDGIRERSQTGEDVKTFKDKVENLSKGAGYNTQGRVTEGSGRIIENMEEIYERAVTGRGGVTFPAPSVGKGDGSLLMSGPNAGMGQEVKHPGGGTGGDINQIPQATGSGWENVKDTILATSKMMGFDPAIAATIAGVESTWNPNANVKGGATSAKGLYQFVDGTWKMMMERYAKKYGIAPNTPPSDARANAILGIQYLIDNYNSLKKTVGKVTDTSLYMAHFLGPGGAARFLNAPHTASVSQVVGKRSLDANPAVFKGRGGYKTVGQVLVDFENKMASIRKVHGLGSGETILSTPELPTPGNEGVPATTTATQVPEVPELLAPAGNELPLPKSSIQDTASKVASTAAGLVSGNTSEGPIGIMAPPDNAALEQPSTTQSASPVEKVPTASTASTTASRDTASAEMAMNTQGIESLLSKQLGVAVSMDGTLKQIREDLLLLATQMGNPPPAQRVTGGGGVTQPQEPQIRNPLSARRNNPVT